VTNKNELFPEEIIQIRNNDPYLRVPLFRRILFFSSSTANKIATAVTILILISTRFLINREISFLSSLSEPEIKRALSFSESITFVASVALILGLAGEWPDDDKWKKSVTYAASKLLVIGGVAVELLSNGLTYAATDAMQQVVDNNTRAANIEASNALDSAHAAYDGAVNTYRAIAWRKLEPDQKLAFRNALHEPKHRVALMYMLYDDETFTLAEDYSEAINAAHWEYGTEGISFSKHLFFGVHLIGKDNAAKEGIANALTAAHIDFYSKDSLPDTAHISDSEVPDAETIILIGHRFPPF
jgi:hypothetical protein